MCHLTPSFGLFSKIFSLLVVLILLPFMISASSKDAIILIDTLPSNCYAISDQGNPDKLFKYDTLTDSWSQIGSTGVNGIEGMALNPIDGLLYAVDQDELGVVDLMTGMFSAIGPALGQADGALGMLTISDVDGLSYDPYLNVFMASVRRNGAGVHDLLIQIDPLTGTIVENAFGANVDYVIMEEVMDVVINSLVYDVDDVAVDITTGELYGIANQGGNGGMLVIYDKTDGTIQTVVGSFNGIDDMEALGFFTDGSLFGATGNNGPDPLDNNSYYEIDKFTGMTMSTTAIDPTGVEVDFEACDCVSDPANLITGTVDIAPNCACPALTTWQDIIILLYNDANSNGVIDSPQDMVIGMDTIDNGQMYNIQVGAVGDFIIVLDSASMPSGFTYVGATSHTANFVGLGQTDNNNDFEFCANLEGTLVSSVCNDNSTPNNGFDDFMDVVITADNDAPGTSNTYEVFFEGTLLNPGGTAYGASVMLGSGEFPADGSSIYTLSLVDTDTPGCTIDVDVHATASCSTCLPVCLPIVITKN